MFRNLYQVLGVAENATVNDIKKAYRQLALKHHPDKCKSSDATERFQEIINAYTALINDDKRKSHDKQLAARRQEEALASSARHSAETFEQEGERRRVPTRSCATNRDRFRSPIFSYRRTNTVLTAEDSGSCAGSCDRLGSPTFSYSWTSAFWAFGATYFEFRNQYSFSSMPSARNVNYRVPLEVLYNGGTKLFKLPRTDSFAHLPAYLEVTVSPGDKDGDIKYYRKTSFDFRRHGPHVYDVSVTIRQIRHEIFSRNNDDLHQKIKISPSAALHGFSIPVPLLNGSTVDLEQGPGAVRTGTVVRLVGFGMPSKRVRGFGDMIVQFEVEAAA